MRSDKTLVGFFMGDQRTGYGKVQSFAPGETIIAAGETIDRIYTVLSGTAISSYVSKGTEVVLHHRASTINHEEVTAILAAGSFMTRKPSRRTYRAGSDCMVVMIDEIKLNDLYNDGNSLPMVRDLIRNSDPEVKKELLRHLGKAFEQTHLPGMDPDNLKMLFRVPVSATKVMKNRQDKIFCGFAAKIICGILKKRTSVPDDIELAPYDAGKSIPPPPPGSGLAREVWEASRAS